ncbi:MAG: arginine--tRNA ligase [Bacteroidetes bacterium]|nr:arginine--tRNA ligase [Bacteroidota bacterium]
MKELVLAAITSALRRLAVDADVHVVVERPRQEQHGDLTSNAAMVLAKRLGRNPRELASQIIDAMDLDPSLLARPEVAGPGFINFTFTDRFFRQELRNLIAAGPLYGRSTIGEGKRVQVEFVSANPTGPLTVGHGRGAVFGDSVARLLEWTGHHVERENYFNNAGRQMRVLGDSVRLRYLELLGDTIDFPEEYYQGEYIRDIARHLEETHGDGLRNEPAEGKFKELGEADIFADIRETLDSLGITFDSFFNENSLYTEGKIHDVVSTLRAKGLVYDREGAVWFKTSAYGAEKDKVIIKSSGEPTYRLPDIAYHREKFRRGFDLMIDVFGADHIAAYPDVLAGLTALDLDSSRVKVLIHQFVTIVQGGEVVKMSTRKANFITLDELIEEVGVDVVRYFFLMRTITSHLNFDLDLAKQQSDENPVYYLQYAHARISSILRYATSVGVKDLAVEPDFDLLEAREEIAVMRLLLLFPELVESCAETCETHRLADYLHDVAGTFHAFYHVHRVVSDDQRLSAARLALCKAIQLVLRNGLQILGIRAPEQM